MFLKKIFKLNFTLFTQLRLSTNTWQQHDFIGDDGCCAMYSTLGLLLQFLKMIFCVVFVYCVRQKSMLKIKFLYHDHMKVNEQVRISLGVANKKQCLRRKPKTIRKEFLVKQSGNLEANEWGKGNF